MRIKLNIFSNPSQSDINVNHEIINALEIEIDDLSNETQNLQKQIQRFTACQRCNSNFEKVRAKYFYMIRPISYGYRKDCEYLINYES